MSKAYELAAMTSPEFAGAQDEIRIALQPIGATEQHGPNLAMGTDFRSAEAISRRLAARLHPKAVVLPAIPYGLSGHHMGFPGTISLSPETMLGLLRDVARSLKQHGVDGLILVNGHNGNTGILNVAAT
ncbi:MAG: creatininase family protein, partial [Trueperaceae bacterium]